MKRAMGAVPNPVCCDWRRARGFGEPILSVSIQRRPCSSGIHHPTSSISMVLLSTAASLQPPLLSQQSCSHGPNTFQPFTSWCPGVPVRAHPPILLSLPGSFLPSLATSTGRGKRECQHHGRIVARLACANPPSIRIHPPSSFTSCLGPWEKEERDEQELGLCQGGQRGEKHMKTTGKNTMYIKKVPVMD